MPPGAKQINIDLAIMRAQSKSAVDQLIPWEDEKELELLSLQVKFADSKKHAGQLLFGSILSIYYEPMVAFAYKEYGKQHQDALLYCRTKALEFVYRLKRNETDVYFNGKPVAVLDQSNVLHGLISKGTLGAIRPYSTDLLSIIVKGKDVGHMFNPLRTHGEQQRAFTIMANLSEEDEYILMALGLFELVTRVIVNKKKK